MTTVRSTESLGGRLPTSGAAHKSTIPHVTNVGAAPLGWFSIALGTAETLFPGAVARLSGVNVLPRLVRALGAREIASGLGILAHPRRASWLWVRVAGDLIDLAVLGTAPLRAQRGASARRTAAATAVAGITLLDVFVGSRLSPSGRSRQAEARDPGEQLVDFLSDMYSVEQQALAQLVSAPKIAVDPKLAEDFRTHYAETQQQAELVRQRLEARGGSPSAIKDAVMRLGGKGFLLFARVMPETPGRLVVHAYSYEAMEWAGYEMLLRFAERAGDHATVEAAKTIRDQERTMMNRLEDGFDAAEQLSHADLAPHQLSDHLIAHLAEVHAFESQAIQLLGRSKALAGNTLVTEIYRHQLDRVRHHARQVQQRLEALNSSPSKIEDAALAIGGLNWSLFFQKQSDTPAKLAAFVYAVLHLEIGGYELVKRTASRLQDRETCRLCETILAEKRAMAEQLAQAFDAAVSATLSGFA